MKNSITNLLLPAVMLALLVATSATARDRPTFRDWPMFRGPGGRSIGQAELPTEWSIADGKNVAWQVDLPGRGVSGPIVVDGKVFVTASSGPNRDRLHVLAFAADTGKPLWHRLFWATGPTVCNETSANAAPTPASDGERIFAFYSSNDLIALDLEGNLLWMRSLATDYPGAGNAFGQSSSPVVVGDVVVVQSESQGNAYVAALDRVNGATRWDLERPKIANWASPIAIDAQHTTVEQPGVLLQSSNGIQLHSADSGRLLLEIEAGCESIPSLTFNRYLYVPASGVQVFDLLASSDQQQTEPIWKASNFQPSSPSPVVADGQLLVINRGGVLTGGSVESRQSWKLRLGGRFWATPVVVGNRVYCINSNGKAYVVELGSPGEKGKLIGESDFGEDILASPAIADNGMFVRSHKHLWKIAK